MPYVAGHTAVIPWIVKPKAVIDRVPQGQLGHLLLQNANIDLGAAPSRHLKRLAVERVQGMGRKSETTLQLQNQCRQLLTGSWSPNLQCLGQRHRRRLLSALFPMSLQPLPSPLLPQRTPIRTSRVLIP